MRSLFIAYVALVTFSSMRQSMVLHFWNINDQKNKGINVKRFYSRKSTLGVIRPAVRSEKWAWLNTCAVRNANSIWLNDFLMSLKHCVSSFITSKYVSTRGVRIVSGIFWKRDYDAWMYKEYALTKILKGSCATASGTSSHSKASLILKLISWNGKG